MSFEKKSIKNLLFFISPRTSSFLFLTFFYFCSLFIAAFATPIIFNLVITLDQHFPCKFTHYLIQKGFTIFFERIRLIALLSLFPFLWKIFRQQSPKKSFTHFDHKIFWRFFKMGSLIIMFFFGSKMFLLDFSWTISPNFCFFLMKSLVGTMILSLLEEWLFRGLIFQILLQYLKPFFAIILSSLLFAHFHFRPSYEINFHSPLATLSDGFYCFYEVIFHSLIGISWFKFLIIFSLGCLLAMAYFNEQNLTASVGLHAGIIFPLMIIKKWISFSASHPFFGSNDLFDSPFALSLVIISIILLHLFYLYFHKSEQNIQ